jgi:transposase
MAVKGKSTVITDLEERIKELESQKKEKKEDEDVCPECGGDLNYVEEGVAICPKCSIYYEVE